MPPKRKAPAKKKESPPPSESELEESEEDIESDIEPDSPKPKKAKSPAKPKAQPKTKAAPGAKKTKVAPVKPAPKGPPSKKETKKATPKISEPEKLAPPVATPEKKAPAKSGSKQIVIEHCKQCQSFKMRALKIQELVKQSVPDVEITINPEKPRKGVFEIREAGSDGKIFLSLTNLQRPFPKLKALNLEETAQDVVAQIT